MLLYYFCLITIKIKMYIKVVFEAKYLKNKNKTIQRLTDV